MRISFLPFELNGHLLAVQSHSRVINNTSSCQSVSFFTALFARLAPSWDGTVASCEKSMSRLMAAACVSSCLSAVSIADFNESLVKQSLVRHADLPSAWVLPGSSTLAAH